MFSLLNKNYIESQFPEALYRPAISDFERYASRVNSGSVTASLSSVVVCGLARDIGNNIKYLIPRIEKIGSLFRSMRVVIVENDSSDGTREKLLQYKKEKMNYCGWEIDIIGEKQNKIRHEQDKSIQRRIDMAYYRNLYLEHIDSWIYKPDYLIIIDTDLTGGYSYEGILNSMGFEEDWTVIGSNSLMYRGEGENIERLYFDTWALRVLGSWKEVCGEKSNRLRMDRGEEPQQVYSCFGGLAIYKYDRIKNFRYDSTDCDCVTLHKKIIQSGGKIYLNPSQITLYNNHQYCMG